MIRKKISKRSWFYSNLAVWIGLFLIVITFATYWPVMHYGFVNFDDNAYISENPYVRAGLTIEGVSWAFTNTYANFWHPLTWLSLILDTEFYGFTPRGYHLTNLLLHAANALVLFVIFSRMTGNLWRSGFIAALFALHPLHVESVAWVAQRKDVLSTFLWLLTLWSYIRYVECPAPNRYLLVLLFFILGLMAKPMLITLPFVLLLLDYWPLGRTKFWQPDGHQDPEQVLPIIRLIWEKIPLFILTAGVSIVAFFAQHGGGAVVSLSEYPLSIRIGNVLVSYAAYMGKMIWPRNMTVFYPHPTSLPGWQIAGAVVLLSAITIFTIKNLRKRPYLSVGWLWYIGTLVPVIGLVKVGSFAMADRYTYITLIGLFIMVAWGVPETLAKWRHHQTGLAVATTIVLAVLVSNTRLQLRYWDNGINLFNHALAVTSGNYIAHNNLGVLLAREGRESEAMFHYTEALRIKPDSSEAHNNFGDILAKRGRLNEAIIHFFEAIKIDPNDATAHYNLGVSLARLGRIDEALTYYIKVLKINPQDAAAHNKLGKAFIQKGDGKIAISHFQEAVRIMPGNEKFQNDLNRTVAIQEEIAKEIASLLEALKIDFQNPALHAKLADLYYINGNTNGAITQYQVALSLQPGFIPALNNLAQVYSNTKAYDKAMALFRQLLEIRPEHAETYVDIACIYALQYKVEEAVFWLNQAVKRGYDDWDRIKFDPRLNTIRRTSYYKTLMKAL
jgi:tetratricopeptide (TPR) repeat protein